MDSTEDDARVASLATELLSDQDRVGLSVSPAQLVRWRKVDAIPVGGSRRGGRGQRAHYLPSAPAAAAALAVALEVDRNLDRAVLAAFGAGAPIPDKRVRAAAVHCFREMENVVHTAKGQQKARRSDIPRRLRVPLKGARRADAFLQSDALLALMLGDEPLSGVTGPSFALDAVAPEVPSTMTQDATRRFEFVMRRLSLAALRSYVQIVDVDRWREACAWVTAALGFADALRELAEVTNADPSDFPGLISPLIPIIRVLNRNDIDGNFSPGFRTAILALVAAMLTATRRRTAVARESVATFLDQTPKLRAMNDLVSTLPEEWRPTLDPVTGPVFLARLPEAEREQALAHTRRWLDEHPLQADVLTSNEAPKMAQST
jgi:hypothetical protein